MTEFVLLADACSSVTDGTHYTPRPQRAGVPFLTVKDLSNGHLDFRHSARISEADYEAAAAAGCAPQRGDVLFSKDGTVGKVHLVDADERFAVLSSLAILRPDTNKTDPRYLAHALRSPRVLRAAIRRKTGSAIRRIILADLKRLAIRLPSIEEQRRIADILEQASAVRAQRLQNFSLLDHLEQSVFHQMFHDASARNPTTTVAGLVANRGDIRTGPFGSQLLHSEFKTEGIAVLGIDNVVTNEFRWVRGRCISPAKYRQLQRYTVKAGDVLITIMGTCGRCAVVPEGLPTAINTKHLCCITLDQGKCLPAFLQAYFLWHTAAQSYLQKAAKGAIMSGLNMGIIKELPVPLIPMALQREFVAARAAIERLRTSYRKSANDAEELFIALQHRAFRGEL